jgi:hypothetical protein
MNPDVRIVFQLATIQKEVDYLINATPTGEKRNELCDANIHLLAALDHMQNAAMKETPK